MYWSVSVGISKNNHFKWSKLTTGLLSTNCRSLISTFDLLFFTFDPSILTTVQYYSVWVYIYLSLFIKPLSLVVVMKNYDNKRRYRCQSPYVTLESKDNTERLLRRGRCECLRLIVERVERFECGISLHEGNSERRDGGHIATLHERVEEFIRFCQERSQSWCVHIRGKHLSGVKNERNAYRLQHFDGIVKAEI